MALPRKPLNVSAQAKTDAAPSAAEKVRETVTATKEIPEGFGSESGSIALIANLGDPSNEDTVTKVVDGEKVKVTMPTSVGYRIKNVSDHDIIIPDFGVPDALRKNLMDFKNPEGTQVLKPGEEADLTRAETGFLISNPIYANTWTGGEYHVKAVYQQAGRKNRAGEVVATPGQAPGVSLARINGSIKDVPFIDVLTVKKEKGSGGRNVNIRIPKAEFPKFASLSVVYRRPTGTSGKTADDSRAEQYNRAEAWRQNFLAAAKLKGSGK